MYNIVYAIVLLGDPAGGEYISQSFKNEEEFKVWSARGGSDYGPPGIVIIEKGISLERCDELCKKRTRAHVLAEREENRIEILRSRSQSDNR